MNDESKYLIELPNLELRVFSFFEIALLFGLAFLIYFVLRKLLLILRNLGLVDMSSRTYKVFNFIGFLIPGIIFLFGITQISRDSFFISLLLFLVFSVLAVVALLDPARNLIATLMIHLKGDLREGDFIQVGEAQGKILRVGPLSLVVQSRGGNKIFFPTQKILRTPYEVHNRGGGSRVAIEVDGSVDRARLEKVAHLCPYKKDNTDVVISKRNDLQIVKVEVHQKELKPLVEKYFLNHL